MKTRTFTSRLPVDLRLTLGPLRRGRLDPCMRIWSRESLHATRTPGGPATVHISVDGQSITVRAWGDGSDWALEHAPDLLGSGDRPEDFEPLHPTLVQLHHSNPGLRIGRSQNVVEFLVPTILEQKVTGKEARRSYMRLVELYGEPAPGPGNLRVPPSVEVLAELPYWEWHELGVERRRAETIRHACSYAHHLQKMADLDPVRAHMSLTSLPGIGNWTASHTTLAVLGNADAVLVGDFHIPHLVTWVLAREPRGSDERMLELLEPYKGHRARVIRLIEAGSDRPQRRAPRVALRSIARI